MRMSIVLIGYRGSGKTTIGRKLASRLWQDLIDTDQLIVTRAGKNIVHIFQEDTRRFYERHGFANIEPGEDYRMLCYIGPTA